MKLAISNEIKLVFNTTPSTRILHPLNTEVHNIRSPKGVVTTSLLLNKVSSRSACSANDELMNDLLDLSKKKTRAGLSKTIIILVTEFGLLESHPLSWQKFEFGFFEGARFLGSLNYYLLQT